MQQRYAPRPLPLFLQLVRLASESDPELARAALRGLARYEAAQRPTSRPQRPAIAESGAATLRDCGGDGAPVVLIPSLINPPEILDLDGDVSLAGAIARGGRRALLVDWGSAAERSALDLGGHIETLLVPLLETLDQPPAVIGYCLGGTMAIAAANHTAVERVATIAAPWRFSGYGDDARGALARLWSAARPGAQRMGALPMEVLQGAFWSLDPLRTVSKFARFAEVAPGSDRERRFVTLEDWANEGEPLPLPAARELIEDLFAADLPGSDQWTVGERRVSADLDCATLHVIASDDRITPAASAPPGQTEKIGAGHVGMVVGSRRKRLHAILAEFLAAPCR
ncbi:MAG TPA: alpha/beta hydrolase [Sphingomicrobium sp.]|nr:alpha/beta hydrolase [Sphingomicrobium sp.]